MRNYWIYLLVMAGVTYLIRAVPFSLCKKEITNPTMKAFLAYIPYTVLAAMTFPAILYATSSLISGAVGCVLGLLLALQRKSLLTVAIASCVGVFVTEYIMHIIGVM
ncbi:MAG: AzlD domain-containing protein [Lachnospiraceae bacterium]|nr:AzlD domain-containing protein [Lachnospiraceae bacterium]